ncbi:EthD family reductase [Gordonia rhizosphera]|uniref:EthD domain-containing protein n=1 Tax=Gordonia rhizosphera NBRC 16068 TaxID=1108045 RepID=K6V9W6_9ACTN|nr:EthD family reductase [Gordonia rhizosphera]GAB93008.1 hypothetical protein GORHZ_200_00440 [Gordonia rhizosphera NBRC 16068]
MSVKVVALIKARPDISREQFLHKWQSEHPAFVWRLPEVERYFQSPAIEHHSTWPYDGLAELYFPSVGAVARAFASPEADALREHEEDFIESLSWFLSTETAVHRPDTSS